MADGPAAGLVAVDIIKGLSNYHLLPSIRGDLLMKLGRNTESLEELKRAVSLMDNAREKQLLVEELNLTGAGERSGYPSRAGLR